MTNIKVLGLSIVVLVLSFFAVSSPLYVSISFDVERDPGTSESAGASFEGVKKIPDILDIMDAHSASGTFFITGRVAERFPETLAQIKGRGHEIGAHGGFYHDERVAGLEEEEQKEKILQTKLIIENITGENVAGYRAPGHWIDKETMATLDELGFSYDSSVVPGIGGRILYKHSILSSDAPYHPRSDDPFLPGDMDLLEIPLTPVFINGNLDALLAYQGGAITKVELIFAALECKIKKKPLVLYMHPGMMADLPYKSANYRSGEYLIGQFDDVLATLDLLGARYVRLEEIDSH